MEIDSENFSHMANYEDVKPEVLLMTSTSSESNIRRRRTRVEMNSMSTAARMELRRAQNRVCSEMLRARKKEKSAEKWQKLENLETELVEIQQENRILEKDLLEKFGSNFGGNLNDLKEEASRKKEMEMNGKWEKLVETVHQLKSQIEQISQLHKSAAPSQKSTLAAQKCRKNQELKWAELEFSALNLEIEIEKEREIQNLMRTRLEFPELPEIENQTTHEEYVEFPKICQNRRLQNQKHRRDSDERKRRRNSEVRVEIEVLEAELASIRKRNLKIFGDSEEVQETWEARKEEITVEVKEREMKSLEKLEKNLLIWRQRHLENEARRFEISSKTQYRPQLCRTRKEIETAEMEIRAKNLEIELEVERILNSEFEKF